MHDAILVLNAGSSSLKFSVYQIAGGSLSLLARGQVEGLGSVPRMKANDPQGRVLADDACGDAAAFGHAEAFGRIADWMRQTFANRYEAIGVGHRIAHGGARYVQPVLIDAPVLAELRSLIPLVPLHQPHNIAGVEAVTKLRPDLPQVACFDTAFHQNREAVTERFALPDEMFAQGIRRWGFHGLSYAWIARQLHEVAPPIADARVIVAHLGSGASMCAMRGGRCVDTTMSFSALDGLPMGTRCGSLDPGVIFHLLRGGMTADEIESMLYRKSGLLGLSGISNDVRDLLASDHPKAKAAIDFFVYRIVREIGSLTAALGGLDGLVFTAGIGENAPLIRELVCRQLDWLGIALDASANGRNERRISAKGTKPSVWVIPTDEEAIIAHGTLSLMRDAPPVATA